MEKKHFIILGRAGIIYYSWGLIILFLSLIFAYESTKPINWPALVCGLLFLTIVLYTFTNSYWTGSCLKLPFKRKITNIYEPQLVSSFYWLKIYEIKVAELEKYFLLRIEKTGSRKK